jgi:Zn-finger protein
VDNSTCLRKKSNYKYYTNKNCEYYPCHNIKTVNCLFCFCPLYPYDCERDYKIINGVKNCSDCTFPHDPNNYDDLMLSLKTFIKRGNIDAT